MCAIYNSWDLLRVGAVFAQAPVDIAPKFFPRREAVGFFAAKFHVGPSCEERAVRLVRLVRVSPAGSVINQRID